MKKIGLFLLIMLLNLYAQKPMEPMDKTIFVFVHGTMDRWSGLEALKRVANL
jgi:hypothetical protein